MPDRDWIELTGGLSIVGHADDGEGHRKALEEGYRLATRHEHATAAPSCRISPEARINPRSGEISLGEGCSVAPGAAIQGNVRMGNNCSVQAYSILVGYGNRSDPDGQIWIGDDVRIAPHVMMIAANHQFDDIERPICEQGLNPAPITIENDVWVAGHVTVTAGVHIGEGSVLGAGAVITHDIPPYSIAMGVPAEVVRKREDRSEPDKQ
ncbi:MAG: acyltransferase [Planctomycetota bacterium]